MMTRFLSAAVLGLAATAMAEYQIDFDPTMLPAGHGEPSCVAHIGFVAPGTAYNAVMSGPSGFPEMYHAVWTNDGQIFSPTPINSIDLFFYCSGQRTFSVAFAPFSTFYLPGPANPPAGPTNFGVDVGNCDMGIISVDDLPVVFELAEPFPNPFNPSSTISFALPTAELVKLNIFNITGQKVATLANEMMVRGTHEVTFDASALSSGVYMYSIEASNFTATKKLVLVK